MNSRYRFKPVYSLSRRAPSADSDTSPRATDAAAPRMQKRNLAQDRIPVKRMNIIVPHLIAPGGRLRSAAAPHHRPAGRSAPHSTASTCPHTTAPHNRCTRRPYDAHTGHCSARSANRTPLPHPLPNLPVSVTSSRKPVVEQWPSLWSHPSTVQIILADAQSAISRSRSPTPPARSLQSALSHARLLPNRLCGAAAALMPATLRLPRNASALRQPA